MTQDTSHPLQKYISSRRKVSSEQKEQILSLGKSLVQEFLLDKECDTLGKWMAHYIAEQIMSAETAKSDAKLKAEKKCCDTILSLWSHRSMLPNGRRPFESFDSVFKALESLDPENENPRYFPRWDAPPEKRTRKNRKQSNAANEWISIANGIDRAARVLIQYSLSQAGLCALDSKTKEWISKALNAADTEEISVILRVITARGAAGEKDNKKNEVQRHIEFIKSKTEKLEVFEGVCHSIRQALNHELSRVESESRQQ